MMERVRREVRLPPAWDVKDFERALASFMRLYGRRPALILGSPAIVERFCRHFEGNPEAAYSGAPRFEGIPLHAAILPPDVIAFEGEIDEEILGDW